MTIYQASQLTQSRERRIFQLNSPPLNARVFKMNIQTLDLGHFTSGTPEQRQQFVKDMLQSFDDSGFVKLVNHGFEEPKLKELFQWVWLYCLFISWYWLTDTFLNRVRPSLISLLM